MIRVPWRVSVHHVRAHWLRSGITVVATSIALFLFCFLVSIVTTLDRVVQESSGTRLVTQSAVSLFVDLPLDYQPKIESRPGVEAVSKFQWFGGIYRDPANFFAQFAVDADRFLEMYRRDLEIAAVRDAPAGADPVARRQAATRAWLADRRAAIIGAGLARDFGWSVGDTVPLLGTIFQKTDGSGWEFNVVAVYRPLKGNVDDRTMFFRFDYLEEMLRSGEATGPLGSGTYAINLAPGADAAQVAAAIDAMFANGPQVTRTTTEAAFQAGFVSMLGNLPLFVATIGGAVLLAVLFSVINTMLMAARQRTHETGILKALGFGDATLGGLVLCESLALTLVGGALGIGLALASEPSIRAAIGSFFPSYRVETSTIATGLAIAAGMGALAGLAPALRLARLAPTAALRAE